MYSEWRYWLKHRPKLYVVRWSPLRISEMGEQGGWKYKLELEVSVRFVNYDSSVMRIGGGNQRVFVEVTCGEKTPYWARGGSKSSVYELNRVASGEFTLMEVEQRKCRLTGVTPTTRIKLDSRPKCRFVIKGIQLVYGTDAGRLRRVQSNEFRPQVQWL